MTRARALRSLETARLALRRPTRRDADAIFRRYASDRTALRWVSFPAHAGLDDTRRFLDFSAREWRRWPAGPLLILARDGGELLGGTGLAYEAADVASTGYVLARDAWGKGYATEALRAMIALAGELGVRRLHALCHPENRASIRVLEKGGLIRVQDARDRCRFPNSDFTSPQPVLRFEIDPRRAGELAYTPA